MEIKRLRVQAKLTQLQLADAMQVDRSTVAHWEIGTAMPRSEVLPKLADLLGCTTDALYGRDDRDSA